jgi:putative Holliday junction resolvase
MVGVLVSQSGRIAGIDYGSKRIGIAVADMSVRIATPHATYTRVNTDSDARFFARFARDEAIERFVVGLPVHLDGRESAQSVQAREFGTWLQDLTGVPVDFFDERFSTVDADEILEIAQLTKKQRTARRDQLAAQIMLAAYLEAGSDHRQIRSIDS